jgi:hypothetical protein
LPLNLTNPSQQPPDRRQPNPPPKRSQFYNKYSAASRNNQQQNILESSSREHHLQRGQSQKPEVSVDALRREPVQQYLMSQAKASYLQNRGIEGEEGRMVSIEECKLEQQESYVCGQ